MLTKLLNLQPMDLDVNAHLAGNIGFVYLHKCIFLS